MWLSNSDSDLWNVLESTNSTILTAANQNVLSKPCLFLHPWTQNCWQETPVRDKNILYKVDEKLKTHVHDINWHCSQMDEGSGLVYTVYYV